MIMALTGLFLITFLIEHLMGNLLILVDEQYFLLYAEFMGSTLNIPIRVMEIVLFLGFAVHIVDGLMLAKQNNAARSQKYAVKAGNKNSTWFSRNMHWTGIVMLTFLILHLISFFIEARFGIDVDVVGASSKYTVGEEVNLYQKVISHFQVLWYVIIYVAAMIFMGFHLVHGFQSAFQTMGWRHKKYFPLVKIIGLGFAIVVPLAYACIPLVVFLKY